MIQVLVLLMIILQIVYLIMSISNQKRGKK